MRTIRNRVSGQMMPRFFLRTWTVEHPFAIERRQYNSFLGNEMVTTVQGFFHTAEEAISAYPDAENLIGRSSY